MLLLTQLPVPNPGAAHEKIQILASATSGSDTDDESLTLRLNQQESNG